jgi:hypothetical protein
MLVWHPLGAWTTTAGLVVPLHAQPLLQVYSLR